MTDTLENPETSSKDIADLCKNYWQYAFNMSNAHYLASEELGRRNKFLGIPAAVISAIVGSSIFASLAAETKIIWLMIVTGFFSISAAVLSALQTFLRFAELSQEHKAAAAGYEIVQHDLDIFKLEISSPSTNRDKAIELLKSIKVELDNLAKISPSVPDDVYDRVVKRATSPVK